MELYPSTPPKLIPSFVCHVDILGYSQLSRDAIKSGQGNSFLNKIRVALTRAYDRVRERSKGWNGAHRFSIKVFTDNIVVGYPAKDINVSFGEVELGHIFSVFSEFQVALTMEGFLVRGGIAFGSHYMDEEIVFGDALIEAVKQDSSGGAPKISLSHSAVQALRHHLGFYRDPMKSPQSRELLQDPDGSIFIDYLANAFIAFPDGGIFFEVFEGHKRTVTEGLEKYSGLPDVRAKYEWAARYHNFVCKEFMKNNPIPFDPDADEIEAAGAVEAQKLEDYLIDIESLAPIPGKLSINPIFPVER
ncbi:hypothetical protein [Marinobacter algicola]|uniref:Uncharacterized protein n=1 Tax=Marinobacter algicola DG893 TaxID=443152 RepID=A6EY07_9GAMM|nr:hypothetical protein [Marinobacter algicola]EDM48716.1 hypothetical protein MDG893_16912 [Marinobacter algicola DG893]